tara:strand:+ start:812 stop:2887 length:2076 start_codon:yes stop_codon:yes gene_type:complete
MTPTQNRLRLKALAREREAQAQAPQAPEDAARQEDVVDRRSAPEEPLGFMDKIQGARNEIMNTASFGLSDPVHDAFSVAKQYITGDAPKNPYQSALQKAVSDQWGGNKKSREDFRRRSDAEGSNIPLATSLAGSVVNPTMLKTMPWMTSAKSLPGTSLRSALLGGGQAGGQAFGEGQDIDEVRKQAAFGTIGGGVSPGAFKSIQKIWEGGGNLVRRLNPQMQETGAARKMMQAIANDMSIANPSMNHGEAMLLAGRRIQELGPRAALMDLGPNSRALAGATYDVPGAAKTQIDDFVRTRHEGNEMFGSGGQADALSKELNKIIPDSYMNTKAGVRGSQDAGNFYKEAFAGNPSMQSNTIDRILRDGYGEQAYKSAVKNMRAQGRTVSVYDKGATAQHLAEGGSGKVGTGIKLEVLNEVKKTLGKMEESSMIPDGFGGLKPGRDTEGLKSIRKRLTNELVKLDATGSYKLALGEAQDTILNRQALQKGGRFMRGQETAEELGDNINKMRAGERHHYKVGAKKEIQKRLDDTTPGGDATKKVMSNRTAHDKTEQAMGDYEDFLKWKAAIKKEKEFAKAYGEVIGGPKTSRNIAAQQSGEVDANEILGGAQHFNFLNPFTYLPAAKSIGRGVGDSMSMLRNPGTNSKLGQLLTGQDFGDMQKMYQRKLMSDELKKQLLEAVTRGQGGYQFQGDK